MSKPPLRPVTPIDPEMARPAPDEDTEIGKARKLAEDNEIKSGKSKARKASRSPKGEDTK